MAKQATQARSCATKSAEGQVNDQRSHRRWSSMLEEFNSGFNFDLSDEFETESEAMVLCELERDHGIFERWMARRRHRLVE